MARQLFSNHAFSTLSGGILAGDLALSVQAGDGALFPALSGGNWFVCTLIDASGNKEIVKATARATDTFTIVRAQEGTSARAFSSGDRVALRVTAEALALLAPLASPTFTGTPLAPTPAAADDDSTKIGTTAWINAAIAAAIGALPAPSVTDYIKVSEVQTNGVAGGTFTSGAWRTRVINTEDSDTGSHCSIASNQITLAAGTYIARITAPAYHVALNVLRLYDTTNAATLLDGAQGNANGTVGYITTRVEVNGKFVLAAPAVLEVQHISGETEATDGFGPAASLGVSEIYTIAEFWKVA